MYTDSGRGKRGGDLGPVVKSGWTAEAEIQDAGQMGCPPGPREWLLGPGPLGMGAQEEALQCGLPARV